MIKTLGKNKCRFYGHFQAKYLSVAHSPYYRSKVGQSIASIYDLGGSLTVTQISAIVLLYTLHVTFLHY